MARERHGRRSALLRTGKRRQRKHGVLERGRRARREAQYTERCCVARHLLGHHAHELGLDAHHARPFVGLERAASPKQRHQPHAISLLLVARESRRDAGKHGLAYFCTDIPWNGMPIVISSYNTIPNPNTARSPTPINQSISSKRPQDQEREREHTNHRQLD